MRLQGSVGQSLIIVPGFAKSGFHLSVSAFFGVLSGQFFAKALLILVVLIWIVFSIAAMIPHGS